MHRQYQFTISPETTEPCFSVSDFLATCNQTLESAYAGVLLEGEVASFKINQNKWVFFDLKDAEASINCFMPVFQLRMPLADGMRVRLKALPKVTKWGKFSLTVQQIIPIGEGALKKSFELLKAKLTKEGLFALEKKRSLPTPLDQIGVISSTQAAGYADFIKILDERWGGLTIKVAHTGVQGLGASDQIIRALDYFNQQGTVQVIAVIRGGGSADDLAIFNDEALVRAIAASRIPVITGIGHEVDETLADLAADLHGSTPSNVAQMLTKDRQLVRENLENNLVRLKNTIFQQINQAQVQNRSVADRLTQLLHTKLQAEQDKLQKTLKIIQNLNPDHVLAQGYAILSGRQAVGENIEITTFSHQISAQIQQITRRKNEN